MVFQISAITVGMTKDPAMMSDHPADDIGTMLLNLLSGISG